MTIIIARSIPSIVHLILTLLYFKYIFGSNGEYLDSRLSHGFIVLFLTNTIISLVVSRGQWRQLLISLMSFIIFYVLYLFYMVATGDPNRDVDENPANGLVLIGIGIPYSFISLFIGTVLGIIIIKLKKQVQNIYMKRREKND
ncbi:hypothetical protein HZF08_01100 [Paenibacillus sp. CGMCC 1.16610]|uniref:Uncharacterized protein n=1 Tax=Paenibacillus anseongense TaxID=2682845 RepID=A0ABW9U2T3_9BACL|nr:MULTISPECIES: hypothetical protein [Paenibacillus]MBA2936896.1 hypothetical protein [Paenibacillus sp. CGMCC 1.16610]MVQ33223.1 hypothetical protein [Paenibacillus anseongense]